MKLAIIFAVIVCLCMIYAQAQRCPQAARRPNCNSRRDVGEGGRNCRARTMWYYRNGECHSMRYRGCGGNGNRYCSKAECERRCDRD